jgi:hypothetical protein
MPFIGRKWVYTEKPEKQKTLSQAPWIAKPILFFLGGTIAVNVGYKNPKVALVKKIVGFWRPGI